MSVERNSPRKTFELIRKMVWKTRKKIRKTIRNATEKCLAPLRPLKNISPALFNKFKVLGQESRRTKVPRIFRIFVPNFALNFAPNFPRNFRGLFVLRFVGDGDQKKFTKNPRHFSMQNSQANTKKIFTKFFWRAGKVKFFTGQNKLRTKKKKFFFVFHREALQG